MKENIYEVIQDIEIGVSKLNSEFPRNRGGCNQSDVER